MTPRNGLILAVVVVVGFLAISALAVILGGDDDDFDTPRRTDADARTDIAYGDDPRQRYDVFTPATGDGPYPTVIWIHGGGWRFGDKAADMPVWDWTDDGYAVVAINHRYAIDGATIADSTADAIAAVTHVLDRADAYAIDADRVGVYGFSAGGHLAAMVGQADVGVAALVVSGAPTDFEPMVDADRSIFEGRPSDEAATLIRTLLGCLGDCAEEVATLSPARLAPSDAPVLVVHGSADTFVDVSQAEAYVARLEADGVDVEFDRVEGGGHATHSSARIEAFFAEHLAG
ncbi:MAG: alpha/beta hydrolase [Actinomycetota bacterium]